MQCKACLILLECLIELEGQLNIPYILRYHFWIPFEIYDESLCFSAIFVMISAQPTFPITFNIWSKFCDLAEILDCNRCTCTLSLSASNYTNLCRFNAVLSCKLHVSPRVSILIKIMHMFVWFFWLSNRCPFMNISQKCNKMQINIKTKFVSQHLNIARTLLAMKLAWFFKNGR